jgi:glucosyl-dolichyl phosphate glucuronosyltransferase
MRAAAERTTDGVCRSLKDDCMYTAHTEGELRATVAICAYALARWDSLLSAVGSVLGQLRPGDECVLVIDHNEQLLARVSVAFADEATVRVLANAGPRGLSGARNTAIAASQREIVAFLDDDAVAGPTWLDRMRSALAAPEVFAVGTAAVPHWPNGGRPSWFPPEFDWVVGCSYLGLPAAPAEVRNVIGAAMAFRREAFDLAGVFSTVVGRVGAAPTGCEETELCIRLRQARPTARVTYLPDTSVTHFIGAERLRLSYFFRRCVGEGLSKARVSRLVGASDGLSSERAYVRATLPRGMRRELRRGLRGEIGGWSASALIVAGTIVTGLAYLSGRITNGIRRSTVPLAKASQL